MLQSPAVSFDAGRVCLDRGLRQLVVDGQAARVGSRAFDLLMALVDRGDRVVAKQELLEVVWPGLVVEENNLQVHVMALRKLLGAQAIVTVSGRGYRFTLPHDHARHGAVPASGAADRLMPTAPRDDLVGRETLVATVSAMLDDAQTRLVTLTGPGGVGKTRVGLRLAALGAARWRDGAYVVMLAAVRDAAQVMDAIAHAIGLQDAGALSAAERVRGFLRPRELLLMLDNLEHLPDAAPQIAGLLADCRSLKVLVTSRARLRLSDEQAFKVPPLALPRGDRPEDQRASAAVAMFARRATAFGYDLLASGHGLHAAAGICAHVDGLPLAIELAAARLRVLSPTTLLARLDQRLPLLTGGGAEMPARQRSLRDSIDWSHELLDADSQQLFRRLGGFVGGFSLEAAEWMAAKPAGTIDQVEQLLEQNLLRRVDDVDGQPRYTMLETIREYALERLAASGEEHAIRQRHALFMDRFAQAQDRRLRSGQRAPALEALAAERNNLRAALRWLLRETGDAALAGRIIGALAWWWYFDDAAVEGQGWADECLKLPMPRQTRARVLLASARALVHGGQTGPGLAQALAAAELGSQIGDRDTEAQALLLQAIPVVLQSQDQAVALMERCLAVFRELGEPWDVALATSLLGMVLAWHPGGEALAVAKLREARERFLALDDRWCLATASHYLALLAARCGDIEESRGFAMETLASASTAGYAFLVAGARHHLAQLALADGDLDDALRWAHASIETSWQQGHRRDVLLHCRWLAALMWRQGRVQDAIALFAVGADDLDENVSLAATIMTPADRDGWSAALAELRASMPSGEWDAAWREGAVVPVERVLSRVGLIGPPPASGA